MKRSPIVSVVSLAIVATLTVSVTAARAQRTHEEVSGGHGIVSRRVGARPLAHHPFDNHRFAHHPFAPFSVIAVSAPPVWDGPFAYYDPAPVYTPPVVYSVPAEATVSIAPGPPPMSSVIQYPTGRYELRGDGISIPLRWVWIPNPPTAPPIEPSAGPSTPSGAPPSGSPASQKSRLYRWIDAQGVVNWTNSWEAVPEQYRTQAKRTRPT